MLSKLALLTLDSCVLCMLRLHCRAYIISMLWATATSLIIHNTGLPPATLISFVWVMGGLTIGWVLIKFHQARIERQAIRNVARDISVNGLGSHDLAARIQQEKGRIADSKTFVERFFSIKALHGIIMFVSWINVAGRAFATNLSKSDRACYTYPVYKPLDLPEIPDGSSVNASSLTLVPTHDPHYERTPWAKLGLVGWAVVMLIAPLAGAAVIGAVWSWLAVWRMKAKQHAATVADNAAGLAGVAGFIAK